MTREKHFQIKLQTLKFLLAYPYYQILVEQPRQNQFCPCSLLPIPQVPIWRRKHWRVTLLVRPDKRSTRRKIVSQMCFQPAFLTITLGFSDTFQYQ